MMDIYRRDIETYVDDNHHYSIVEKELDFKNKKLIKIARQGNGNDAVNGIC